MTFQEEILQGIPAELPVERSRDSKVSHAPKRKDILDREEKKLALRNALRYFPKEWHAVLGKEFLEELEQYGRIYMYRFMPSYDLYARPVTEYPAKSRHAAAIMLMIQNNLDPAVAQHPEELITYGVTVLCFRTGHNTDLQCNIWRIWKITRLCICIADIRWGFSLRRLLHPVSSSQMV